jgi:hypothetical protein
LLIPDGYTATATIPARGRVPALTISFRPALPAAVYEYQAAPRLSGKDRLRAVTGLLTTYLVSWDACGLDGSTLPVTAENIGKVPHRVLEAMVDHVTGYSADEQATDLGN